MHIVIRSTENQKQELLKKGFSNTIFVQWINANEKLNAQNADAYFDLVFDEANYADNEFIYNKLVFVNAVVCNCKEINMPNYIRLNAWNGFLNRDIIELVCCNNEFKKKAEIIFNEIDWKFCFVADDYGLVAARIIAMIINEAYFALQEKVSTKSQIDTAMKLGTNYAFGPFEWSEKIGLKNILKLLQKLSTQNKRYEISSLLVQESQQF